MESLSTFNDSFAKHVVLSRLWRNPRLSLAIRRFIDFSITGMTAEAHSFMLLAIYLVKGRQRFSQKLNLRTTMRELNLRRKVVSSRKMIVS